MLRSDREQALRSEVPCASVFGSSGEVLGELPGGLLLVPTGLLSSAVKNHATQKIAKVVSYMINKINPWTKTKDLHNKKQPIGAMQTKYDSKA